MSELLGAEQMQKVAPPATGELLLRMGQTVQ
jgi:hypothetical protein